MNLHSLGRVLQHVVTVPAGDRNEGNGLGIVANLFDEVICLLDDLIETVFAPLHATICQDQN